MMKIVTLNTWGTNGPYEKRFELIGFELKQLNPDIVCLQEVFDARLEKLIKEKCGFKNSHVSYPAGLSILSNYSITETRELKYRALSQLETNDRRAIFSSVQANDDTIWVGNTHLAWKAEDDAVRFAQAKELLDEANPLEKFSILTGDFNCTSDTAPILQLKKSGFVDVFETLHPNEKGYTWDNDRNSYLKTPSVVFPNRRIDLILATKGLLRKLKPKVCELAFTKRDADGTLPSDHFGVFVEFE